ncbi:MAG: lysylphosphatidylglycerol synthase transmembrane domain-containing protein [Rhodothermales bacterium]
MKTRVRRILVQVGIFALAGVLLYLALRSVEFDKVGDALREADYRWIAPLAAITLLSHFLRAWRWKVLLEALPSSSPEVDPRLVSIKTAFYSVMIGYMVNYAAPRLGEVARTANLAAKERLSFSGVLGTVVVERILDLIMLAVGLVGTFFLLIDHSAVLQATFITPIQDWIEQIPLFTLLILLLGVSILGVFLYWIGFRDENARLRKFWDRRLRPLLTSFIDGLATVKRSPRPFFLIVSTLVMWFCYLMMAYIPLIMFDMAAPYDLSLLDTVSIMFLGALGVAIPSPGGLGSYHYITIQVLGVLFGVDESIAATYAVFVHGGQMVFYIIIGFLCFLLQGSSFADLRSATKAARHTTHDTKP